MKTHPALYAFAALVLFGLVFVTLECYWGGLDSLGEMERARAHYRAGEYKDAARLFKKALAERKEDLEGHREYQNALRKLGRIDEAAAEYGAILVRHPNDAWAHYLKARIAEPERFREGMKKALELDPAFAPASLALAHEAMDDKRPAEAIPYFEKAFEKGGIGLDELKRYCAACYGEKKYDSIDRVLARLSEIQVPPGLQRIGIPLGVQSGRTLLLLLPATQLSTSLLSLQFLQKGRSYRMISLSRNADAYVVSWTNDWEVLVPDQEPKVGVEVERSKTRPTFRELHEKAVTLLGPDEKKE